MKQIPACLLAAMTVAVAVRDASAAGRSAWMEAARAGEVPEVPAGAAIPAAALPADWIVRTLSGMGRDCAIEVAGDFLDDGMRAARIAPLEVMPDGRRVADDALGRRCNRGQEPAWAVSAGEDAEDLPLGFGWRRQPIGVVNRADLAAALGRDFQAAELVREDGGRYRVSRLVRSDGSVPPAEPEGLIAFLSKMPRGTERDAAIAAIPADYYARMTGRQVAVLLGKLSDAGHNASKGCYSCPYSDVTYDSIPRGAWARMELADMSLLAELIRESQARRGTNTVEELVSAAFRRWMSAAPGREAPRPNYDHKNNPGACGLRLGRAVAHVAVLHPRRAAVASDPPESLESAFSMRKLNRNASTRP